MTTNIIVKQSKIDLKTRGVNVVNDVFKHDGDSEIGLTEKRGVSSDILAETPENSVRSGLGGAGAEEFHAGQPYGGDPIVLGAIGGGGELQSGVCPGAVGRRGVGGVGGGEIDGVGEGVREEREGA